MILRDAAVTLSLGDLFDRSEFLTPTWVTPQYRATSKKKICACVRLILVLVGGRQTAKTNEITRTFRPWTHMSDDSYIYQLSLVVATATVSFWISSATQQQTPQTNSTATGTVAAGQQRPRAPTTPCLLYTSPSPRDQRGSRMPSSA